MTHDEKQPNPVSQQLPFDIRMALVRASKVKDPLQRVVAIETVQAMARARFPNLFRKTEA